MAKKITKVAFHNIFTWASYVQHWKYILQIYVSYVRVENFIEIDWRGCHLGAVKNGENRSFPSITVTNIKILASIDTCRA